MSKENSQKRWENKKLPGRYNIRDITPKINISKLYMHVMEYKKFNLQPFVYRTERTRVPPLTNWSNSEQSVILFEKLTLKPKPILTVLSDLSLSLSLPCSFFRNPNDELSVELNLKKWESDILGGKKKLKNITTAGTNKRDLSENSPSLRCSDTNEHEINEKYTFVEIFGR